MEKGGKDNVVCKVMSVRELMVKNHFGMVLRNNMKDHDLKVKVTFKHSNFELQDASADGKSAVFTIPMGKDHFCWLKPQATGDKGQVSYKVAIQRQRSFKDRNTVLKYILAQVKPEKVYLKGIGEDSEIYFYKLTTADELWIVWQNKYKDE